MVFLFFLKQLADYLPTINQDAKIIIQNGNNFHELEQRWWCVSYLKLQVKLKKNVIWLENLHFLE